MPLRRIAPEATWSVGITWSRPASYQNTISNEHHYGYGCDHWLYMILGKHGASPRKVFYIGKVYNTYVGDRLKHQDHRRRYSELEKAHPKHGLTVSLGTVRVKNGKITKHRIDQIETMLIYTASEAHKDLINRSKLWTLRVNEHYEVRNKGYYSPLPREIHHGIFER